jgi:tRNA 2-selenouridine synthase
MAQQLSCLEFLNAPGLLLDVRSPSEFAQGHMPGAFSLPLFTDAERAEVGICYKHEGRDAAVELGFRLAGPKFAGFISTVKPLAPDRRVRLHCWRGGMRSEAVGWVLQMGGMEVSLLTGGYKAFRRWGQHQFETAKRIVVVGGMTGTGKTKILRALAERGEQIIDLEALANHRGSSFGALGLPPQPSNEQFENDLAIQWAQLDPQRSVWIEAESRRVGLCRIPDAIFQQMSCAPILEIQRSRAERLTELIEVYGQAELPDLIIATERIRKRLGGLRTQQAVELLRQGELAAGFDLILDYYDRTYTYDLQRRSIPVCSIGATGLAAAEVAQLLTAQAPQLLHLSTSAGSTAYGRSSTAAKIQPNAV